MTRRSETPRRALAHLFVLALLAAGCTGEIGERQPALVDSAPLEDSAPSAVDAAVAQPVIDAQTTPVCGDTRCDGTENPWECSEDCGMPSIPADFSGVRWLHSDVSSWPQTATLDNVNIRDGSLICLPYDKADVWPGLDHVGAFVNGNPWIFIHRDGVIYAATWEWLRHGQTCKSVSAVAGDHIKQDPFWDFQPTSGTWYGFMVSGLARDSTRNAQERSNVVLFRWP